jgi:two-component system cell cycle sensor histidine kinase/response regulator CckA
VYIPEIITPKSLEQKKLYVSEIARGDERILVVDDEDAIAQLIYKMLEPLGYKVTTFTSSIEALEIFPKQPNNFDLIITDMTMPKMTGMELSQEVLKIAPDIPIIICTGFSNLITNEKALNIGAKQLIMKPVIKRDMAKAIREVLDNH